jgi:hypothetical protein
MTDVESVTVWADIVGKGHVIRRASTKEAKQIIRWFNLATDIRKPDGKILIENAALVVF